LPLTGKTERIDFDKGSEQIPVATQNRFEFETYRSTLD
jgi:hypothetical protein